MEKRRDGERDVQNTVIINTRVGQTPVVAAKLRHSTRRANPAFVTRDGAGLSNTAKLGVFDEVTEYFDHVAGAIDLHSGNVDFLEHVLDRRLVLDLDLDSARPLAFSIR